MSELIMQVMNELRKQGVPADVRQKILESWAWCILENIKYKGIHY